MDLQQFVDLGYKAAERLASKIDIEDANECAATSLVNDIDWGRHQPVKAIMTVQARSGVNLSSFLVLDDDQRDLAMAAFAAGCLKSSKTTQMSESRDVTATRTGTEQNPYTQTFHCETQPWFT